MRCTSRRRSLSGFRSEIVVTSYMDHPVGQFFAAYVAATNRVSARCGLFTHALYEPEAFIERIQIGDRRDVVHGSPGRAILCRLCRGDEPRERALRAFYPCVVRAGCVH